MQLILILKGLWIGATMTIPGVSGGTMAVIVGVYEDLIRAVNGLRKEPGKSLAFLLRFSLGAGVGFLLLARFISFLLENNATGEPTRLFFTGIVVGGIPLLVEKSGLQKFFALHLLYLLGGAGSVLLLTQIPQGLFSSGEGISYLLLQFIGGFLVALALVLPGISVSHMLYILGLYQFVLERVYAFHWFSLLPLILGVLAGTFLTAGALEHLLDRHPSEVYLTIIGFVAGSIVTLLPAWPLAQPWIGLIFFITGFFVMFFISRHAR